MTAPKTQKSPARARARRADRHIAVRMYNVGFGDCFLLRIPTEEGERRVLVDCGYHSQGKGAFDDKRLVTQIAEDLAGDGLDVVVATHRHQDHISGFGETDLWKRIAVEEVWLPFTAHVDATSEDPALAAWGRLLDAVPKLVDARGDLTPAAISALGARSAEDRGEVAWMLWNARANAPGIENLRHGMRRADGTKSKRRYLPDSKRDFPSSFETDALPGVKVHVLGPPRDPAFRKSMKVPPAWGVFADDGTPDVSAVGSPFGPEWRVPSEMLPPRRPFQDKSLKVINGFNDDLLAAAASVDGFLNGESLVLVLEFGRARLLLPGDAEVGTWKMILGNDTARELAASATFLKVGHHGSHNATPLVFLKDDLEPKVPAMISTQQGDGPYRNGIPRRELLKVIEERDMPLARSDRPRDLARSCFKADAAGRWIDAKIPC